MKHNTMLIGLLVLTTAAASAGDGRTLSYTYLDAEYAIDSAIEIYGDSSDSDNAFSLGGSWQVSERFVLWGRYGSSSYDLPDFGEHLNLTSATLGALVRFPIRGGDSPLDVLAGLSYEHLETDILTRLEDAVFSDSGLGLRAGVRAGLTPHFNVSAHLHYFDYGVFSEGFRNELDGLFFELGAELALTRRFSLIGTYLTGELDYVDLPGLERPVEVEVDRDEIRLGVRFTFRPATP